MAKKPKNKGKKDAGEKAAGKGSLPYPWWARFVVLLALLIGIGFASVFASAMLAGVKMVRQAQDPAFIAKSLEEIADFQKPLPEGFKYQLAASAFNANMVTLTYEPDGSGFMLGVLPAAEKRSETARQMADQLADKGIPNVSDELKIEKRDSMKIGGETLEYVLGSAPDSKGHKVGGFIGCTLLKDGRAFLVYGVGPQAASNGASEITFNLRAAELLLSSIKGFRK
ncbi:MAG: hypothetical protein K2X27_12140 [Candidatus Obscuribacterales bacterium]|nr:hypothetical protein [Candidatus Obscuribacterales bacterium]